MDHSELKNLLTLF